MMTRTLPTIAVFAMILVVAPFKAADASVIYNFETVATGTVDPFSVTVSGLTASFSSPGTFQVASFQPNNLFSGNSLFDADAPIQPLFVGFSSVLNDISLVFAQNGAPGAAFTLTALLGGIGGATVGTVSVNGSNAFSPFPGGTISFGGVGFDAIRLSTTTTDFAVDNITVNAVPEPASLLLLGSGIAGLAARLRRRSGKAA
jgi:hypothetical protein